MIVEIPFLSYQELRLDNDPRRNDIRLLNVKITKKVVTPHITIEPGACFVEVQIDFERKAVIFRGKEGNCFYISLFDMNWRLALDYVSSRQQ